VAEPDNAGKPPPVTPVRDLDPVGRALAAVDRLSDWGGWAAAASVLAILGLIVAEVLARNLFNYSIDFAWEFSAYFMGAAFMLGAGYSLRAGAQIRVNVLLDNLQPAPRLWIDALATLCCAAIAVYLAAALGLLAWLSWTRGSRSIQPSELPLWIPQLVLMLGAALFALQTLARLARLLRNEPGEDQKMRLGQDVEAEAS
jgi:TRAP-type mannitol/chloroaromatic compound transport system permease small subunit